MLIDRIFQAVKTLVNTDGNGNFDPSDFNLMLNLVILEKYEGYITEINQQTNRENRGLINGGLENVPDRIREKLLHYLETGTMSISSGFYPIPADVKYFDTIITPQDVSLEPCKSMEEFNAISKVNASLEYPICIKIGNKIKVAPATIVAPLVIFYLRVPLFAKWTYNIIGGAELFNPSATDFQDADIHVSEEDDIVQRVAFKFGINLKDPELTATMTNEENTEFNKNNAV